MLGLTFLVATDQFINLCFGNVLQIPNYNPVFKREHSNRMYSVHAYWTSHALVGLSLVWIYPLIISFCSYYCYALENHTFADVMSYCGTLALTSCCGGFFGLAIGSMTDD